jgi:putative CocE/NonD family hydrolase
MRIETALLVWVALTAAPGHAQIPVPEAARSGPAALEAALPELACQMLTKAAANPAEQPEQRSRLQFTCGDYQRALESLGEQSGGPLLRLELHARATLLAAREGITYGAAFKSVLEKRFARFDDAQAVDSAWMLGLPPFAARANLDRRLRQLAGKAALTPEEMGDLLFWHSAWQAVDHYAPALDAAIAIDDAQRFVIDRGVPIKTDRGATLSADIVRPRRLAGRQPAALRFTIYSDPVFNLKTAKDAAARGFVGVLASARGKNVSTDKIVPWETEVEDTRAVIDWISRQPWSDGQVGMYGNSYDAFAQWAAAKNPHPALKTIVPSGASSPGSGLPMHHNVFQMGNYGWPLRVTNDRFMGDPALNDWNRWSSLVEKWFAGGQPLRTIDAIDGTPNEVLRRQMRHPSFDAYWQAMQPYGREFSRIDIPVLSLTGYFDDAGASAVNYLVDHYRYNRNAEHYLVIGPWPHNDNLSARKSPIVNGYAVDPVSNIDTETLVFQWFDHVMRKGPLPSILEDRINYQVMGTNSWAHSPSLAKMANRTLRLYLSNEAAGNRYTLSSRKPRSTASIEQRVDLADRRIRNNLYPVTAFLETPDAPTRISYVSEPFEQSVCVCGMVTGMLEAIIDRKDFDFTWSLYEATPDGKFFNLSYYLGRASYARDPSSRTLLTPGKPASLPFSQTPLVARQLTSGSRLLLLLTVNKNPYAQVNYGTGKDVSDESVADADGPLKVQWRNASYFDIPLRDAPSRAAVK